MLIKKNVKNQIKKRKKYCLNYTKLKLYKLLLSNHNLSSYFKLFIFNKYSKFQKRNGIAVVNKYCLKTSNFRSVYSKFKLSRQPLKYFASIGRIPGLYKK